MSATPITLQQLAYFLSAVEHGSLSAAAEANFIAQPSLSEQIRRLESHLGVSLFIRTNRKLILTDAARMLIPHAQRTIAAAEEAAAAVDPVRTLSGGSVAFGTFSSAHLLLHTDLVANFRALYPLVRVRIVELNSVQIADAVREGELEAGLVALPVDDRGLEIGDVAWTSDAVYLTKDRARAAQPMTIKQIASADLILPDTKWGEMDPTRRQLLAMAQTAGVSLNPVIEVESTTVAMELAQRGIGDTIVTHAVAEKVGATKHLHWAPLSPTLNENFAFITRRYATLSPATTIMIRLARQLLADIPRGRVPERSR
ncbi:LysR family transcriptional regulator [Gordonia sp. CPCC 205515]|uniref:LysR family transcriptional regulator n=1 Tax=Gordonia sp. CPCC 205515 TaxID=3140791 RepID=UPI003AF3C19B